MAYYWNTNGNVMDREIRRKESTMFFTNLKQLAEMNGFSTKDLAGVLDICPTYIYKYLSGKTVPREDMFESMKRRAVDFFDVSITELLEGDFKNVKEEPIEEPVIAEPIEEEDKEEPTVLNEMADAINKRKERVAQLTKEIAALEQALALMKADAI